MTLMDFTWGSKHMNSMSVTQGRPRNAAAFGIVTTLFFAWGFVTSNNDPLIAALRAIYKLSYAEAMLTQFAFFLAYAVASLPGAALLDRLGFVRTIVAALGLMIVACMLVLVASHFYTYALVLVALFLLAGGITALQVAANPLAASLGSPERSHFRLTLAQAFNSLGVVLGVQVGSRLMLNGDIFKGKSATIVDPVARIAGLAAVDHAFIVIAVFLAVLAGLIWLLRSRIEAAAPRAGDAVLSPLAALQSGWAVWGAIAIFLYVGAEVSIGSAMINFLNRPDVLGVSLGAAGWYTGWVYWFGALVGRFAGSILLTRLPASRLLAIAAAIAVALTAIVIVSHGPVAAYAALAIGLFNSIMFPTIFTLTLARSEAPTSATSGLLCVAIVGGAILPWLFGRLADATGLNIAFALPALAYAVIVAFALSSGRGAHSDISAAMPHTAH